MRKIIIGLSLVAIALASFLALGRPSGDGVRILFVGDMMFDRTIRKRIDSNGFDHVFSCASSTLASFDLVVGNLEGPITILPSTSLGTAPGAPGNMTFTFPIETAAALARNNVKAVSIGNNHIYDFGSYGLGETRGALAEAGVAWFGDPADPLRLSYIYEGGGKRIALIGYNQFLGTNKVPKVIEEIGNLREAIDHIVVFAHWGEEYVEPTAFMRETARSFIDAGADLIIGAHPHVIQEKETYEGKEIYYSLGNFIFDQYWEESVRKGQGVAADFGGRRIRTETIDFDINRDGTTCPAP